MTTSCLLLQEKIQNLFLLKRDNSFCNHSPCNLVYVVDNFNNSCDFWHSSYIDAKRKPKVNDIEFVLVDKEQTPKNKNTKYRADRNSRTGGINDPKNQFQCHLQNLQRNQQRLHLHLHQHQLLKTVFNGQNYPKCCP